MAQKSSLSILEQNIGKCITIGTYEFTQANIIRFAEQYDPQVFHTNPEAAKTSSFGALCASGWQVVAVWMQLNVRFMAQTLETCQERGEVPPLFGPSPGLKNLRWLQPTYADDVLAYTTTINMIKPLQSKPGWSMLSHQATASNQFGEQVMRFDGAAMVRLPA